MNFAVHAPRALALFVSSAIALAASSAAAFCGLQSCPRPAGHGEVPRLETALRTRVVAYDIAGNEGHYIVTAPRVFLNYGGFAVGAEVPLTRLDNGGVVATGLSNPLVTGRYARRLSYEWSGEVGLQWELPLGNQEDGLAGDHHMLLPWVGVRRDFGSAWAVTGMFGISSALDDHEATPSNAPSAALAKAAHEGHDHGDGTSSPVLVNPHADRELQGRVAASWASGPRTLEGFLLGQQDLTSTGPETYARLGASCEWVLARFTALQVAGDLPVTAARRNEAEIGVTIKTGW